MKKLLTILLALTLLLSLAACGGKVSPQVVEGKAQSETEKPGGKESAPQDGPQPTSDYDPESPQQAMRLYQEQLTALKEKKGHVTRLEYLFFGEGGASNWDITESADEFIDRLSKVTLVKATDMVAEDMEEYYTFTFDDGTEATFCFNGGNYRLQGKNAIYGEAIYEVENYRSLCDASDYGVLIEE